MVDPNDKANHWMLERIHNAEIRGELHERRITVMEETFRDFIKMQDHHLTELKDAVTDVKKVVYRTIWFGMGVGGTLLLFWTVGKEFIKVFFE